MDLEAGTLGQELAAAFPGHGSLKIQSRRAGEGIGRSFQRAKRRVERRLGRLALGKRKKKVGCSEEISGSCKRLYWNTNYYSTEFVQLFIDLSRRSSIEMGEGLRDSEIVILKERRLIPCDLVKEGMSRFSFLLETCSPGSVPDPPLIAALLDLV